MTRPKIFWIKFDNQTRIFHNGQKITGNVYIENDEELEIEGKIQTDQYFKLLDFNSSKFVENDFLNRL